MRPHKASLRWEEGKKLEKTVTVVCPVLLTQPQESSVYYRLPHPGPEIEAGYAADRSWEAGESM